MRPPDMPPADRFEHGSRARYVCGCRCDACRAANTAYYHARKVSPGNPLIDAAPVRAHLLTLSAQSVGTRAVADASDVSRTVLADVLAGRKLRVRAETARRVLEVTAGAVADHAVVLAGPTWKLVRKLLARGLTKGEIAIRLGCQKPALQIGRRRVLASTALAVARLWREVQTTGAISLAAERGDRLGNVVLERQPDGRVVMLKKERAA